MPYQNQFSNPNQSWQQNKDQARFYIENFQQDVENIQLGFDVNISSLFFFQLQTINYSGNAYPQQYKMNVDNLEKLASPWLDSIYLKDIRYLYVKRKYIVKRLQKKYSHLSRKMLIALDDMIAKEKYEILMYLLARLKLFPMNKGTLRIDPKKYEKVRDAFIYYYTKQSGEQQQVFDDLEAEEQEEIEAIKERDKLPNSDDKEVEEKYDKANASSAPMVAD